MHGWYRWHWFLKFPLPNGRYFVNTLSSETQVTRCFKWVVWFPVNLWPLYIYTDSGERLPVKISYLDHVQIARMQGEGEQFCQVIYHGYVIMNIETRHKSQSCGDFPAHLHSLSAGRRAQVLAILAGPELRKYCRFPEIA